MNIPLLITTTLLPAMFAAGLTGPQLAAKEIPSTVDHEPAQIQSLPDYVRQADSDGFKGVSDALFLGRAGIGEYWQYKQGEETCIGLFYYEDGSPYMSGVCGDPNDEREEGFSFTSVVQDGDEVVAQAAWFSGNWDPETSNRDAIIRYASADGAQLAEDEDPLGALFTEVEVSLPSRSDNPSHGSVSMIRGEDLTLQTS